MTLREIIALPLVEEFVSSLRSEGTARAYSFDVASFVRALLGIASPEATRVSSEEVVEILRESGSDRILTAFDQACSGLAASSEVRRSAGIRKFLLWAWKRFTLPGEVPGVWSVARVAKLRLEDPLSDDELRRLLQATLRSGPRCRREQAEIVLLLHGLTTGELERLRWSDLNLPDDSETIPTARVVGATGKTREIELDPTTVLVLRTHRTEEFGEGRSWSSKLFMNRFGDELSARSVRKDLVKLAKRALIDREVNPRLLRQTGLRRAMAKGMSVQEAHRRSGVKHLSTFDRYL